jgi:hypothetical protein
VYGTICTLVLELQNSQATPAGANKFSTEAQAKARCPSDIVVWVTLTSKIYHFGGTRYYGNTKNGAYMCENDTAAAGMRAAKNETHPCNLRRKYRANASASTWAT